MLVRQVAQFEDSLVGDGLATLCFMVAGAFGFAQDEDARLIAEYRMPAAQQAWPRYQRFEARQRRV